MGYEAMIVGAALLFAWTCLVGQWEIIRRQQKHIRHLTDLVAIHSGDPNVVMSLDTDQRNEALQNQQAAKELSLRPIT